MKIATTAEARHRAGLPSAVALVVLAALPVAGCSSGESATTTQAATTTEAATTTVAPTTTVGTTTTPGATGVPVVVDSDLGMDSVLAVLYLLGRPDLEVLSVTVSGTGLVHCAAGVRQALGLVELAGGEEVPVACGPEAPLAGENAFPAEWRAAADGLFGVELPVGGAPSELGAPELLVSLISASPEPVVVFTDGPLTNLAAALRLDPGIVGNVAMVYTMGGAVEVAGNALENPQAEFNIWVDPTAAAEVFASGVPLTLVPLDATNQVPLQGRHLRALQEHATGPVATAAVALLEGHGTDGSYFWDSLTASLLADESLAEFETMLLAVVTAGGPDAVGTTQRTADGAEVRVAMTVDTARFEQEFLSALAGEDVGPIEAAAAGVGTAPVASVAELIPAIHTATNEKDDAAFLGMITDDCRILIYAVDYGVDGVNPEIETFSLPFTQVLPSSQEQLMETGEVVVSGDAGAAALRIVYPDGTALVGFNTGLAEPLAGGFLYAGGALIAAWESAGYAEADPALVAEVLAAQAAAWAAGDIDGVLAGYWEQAEYIDGFTYETLTAAELADFYAGMSLEFTGEPLISGPFFAVATRVTDLASGAAIDGVSVYWIREGQIALHLLTTSGT